jgi:hypothetical protein
MVDASAAHLTRTPTPAAAAAKIMALPTSADCADCAGPPACTGRCLDSKCVLTAYAKHCCHYGEDGGYDGYTAAHTAGYAGYPKQFSCWDYPGDS